MSSRSSRSTSSCHRRSGPAGTPSGSARPPLRSATCPLDGVAGARRVRSLRGADGSAGSRRYLILDVFSATPLEGNQLAVFTDASGMETAEMQALARELRLSETVFMLAPRTGGDAMVRIFTPAAELPFAGHPVLGSAAVLAGALRQDRVVLETGTGPVEVTFDARGRRTASGWMSQPLPSWSEFAASAALLGALGVEASLLPVEVVLQRPHSRLCGAALARRRWGARTRRRRAGEAGRDRSQLLRRRGREIQDPHVRARPGSRRGPRNGVRRRPSCRAPRPSRPGALR